MADGVPCRRNRITVTIKREEALFYDVGLEVTEHTKDKPIRFACY